MIVIDFKNLNLEQTLKLNESFKEARDIFEYTVEKLCKYNNTKEYLLSPNASRDRYSNHCFEAILQFCFLKNSNLKIHHIYIKNSNPYLYLLTQQLSNSWTLEKPNIFKNYFNILRQFFSLFFNECLIKLSTFFYKKSYPKEPIILLDIFILNSMINENGIKDRYYPNYKHYFKNENQFDFYYFPTFSVTTSFLLKNFTTIVKMIKKDNFIIPHQYLNFFDYFKAFNSYFTTKFNFPRIAIENIDYSTIFKTQHNQNPFNHNWIQSLLFYESIKNLSKTQIKINTIFDWNENQSIDFALNLGFNNFFKNTKRYCYQGIMIDQEINFHLIPNKQELERNLCSNDFLTISPYLLIDNKKTSSFINFIPAPALRFISNKKIQNSKRNNAISVILPVTLEISLKIISLIGEISTEFSNIIFYIKPHPSTSINQLPRSNIQNIFITNESTEELLTQSRICITTNSSVCTEALIHQNKIFILYCLSELCQIPLPKSLAKNTNITASFSKQDLCQFINQNLQQTEMAEEKIDSIFFTSNFKF